MIHDQEVKDATSEIIDVLNTKFNAVTWNAVCNILQRVRCGPWTRQTPTKPGIYFMFHREFKRVAIGEVYGHNCESCRAYDCKARPSSEVEFWIGPIGVPEAPGQDNTEK